MKNEKVSIKRHILKSISYRFLGTLQTIIITYILTKNFVISSSVGVIGLCIKPLIYFLHERIWYKYIKFGISRNKEKINIKNIEIFPPIIEPTPTIVKKSDKKILNYSSSR